MKFVITGGSGLIGRHLAAALIERGDEVISISRRAERARLSSTPGVAIIEADPTVPGPWQDHVTDSDVVVNLAGESLASGSWSVKRKHAFRRSRLETTRRVVEAVQRSDRVKLLLSGSAVGIYGDGGREPLYEEREASGDYLGRLAYEWESCAAAASDVTRVVMLRFGVVLAADGGALARMAAPFRWRLGGPLGSGKQYLAWIHIEDVLRAIFFILENEELTGPVNIVAPDPPTQREFAEALGRVLDKPSGLPTPTWVLHLVLGEMATMVLASLRAVPKALRAHGFSFRFRNVEEALRDLLLP